MCLRNVHQLCVVHVPLGTTAAHDIHVLTLFNFIKLTKVVDFRRLALAVPIRLQNKTTCTRDILLTQQKIVNSR